MILILFVLLRNHFTTSRSVNLRISSNTYEASFLSRFSRKTRFKVQKFHKFIDKDIKFDSNDFSQINTSEHTNLYGPVSIIKECLFQNCHASSLSESICGGAISAHFGYTPTSLVKISNVLFLNCSAKSSGGAFFVTVSTFEAHDVCVTLCSAESNQAFYVHSLYSKMKRMNALYNGIGSFEYVDQKVNIGLSGGKHKITITNSSINTASRGAITSIKSAIDISISLCCFSQSEGNIGLVLRKIGKFMLSYCVFTNNSFLNGHYMTVESNVLFQNDQFVIGNNSIAPKEESYFITFQNCTFDLNISDIVELAPDVRLDNVIGNSRKLKIVDISQKDCYILNRIVSIYSFHDVMNVAKWVPFVCIVVVCFAVLYILMFVFGVSSKKRLLFKHNSLHVPANPDELLNDFD